MASERVLARLLEEYPVHFQELPHHVNKKKVMVFGSTGIYNISIGTSSCFYKQYTAWETCPDACFCFSIRDSRGMCSIA